ncbi:MAG TPA: carboxypeptidase-like regulatory domain-containing protein, partial [Humisphaera sp.]
SVVKGEAYDLTTSKPVAGARVTLTKNADGKQVEVAAATADADGRFEVTKVPPGDYQVVAAAEGRATRLLGYAHFGTDTLKRYTVQLSPAVELKGSVTDDAGRPVANLAVRAESTMAVDGRGYLTPSPPAATTDAQGRFTLAGLPKGYCQVFVSGGGYHQADLLKVHAVPTENLTIRVGATGSIGGKVVTPAGGPPKAPYIVNLTPEGGNKVSSYGGSATLGPDGTFRFENVPPGRYTVTARPNPGRTLEGIDPNAKTVDVVAGRTAAVEIRGE